MRKNKSLKKIPGKLLAPNKTHINRFKIKSESSGNIYTIAQSKSSKQWQCSCMGWIRWRKCKHLAAVLPVLTSSRKVIK